jgi:hypothetical protein
MSATHLDVYTASAGGGVGDIDITLTGASVRSGDRLVLAVCADGNSSADGVRYDSSSGDDAGFTTIGSSTQSCTVYAFHKHATQRDEGAPTYNFKIASGTEKMVVSVLHIRGDDGLDGTPVFLQNVGDATPDSPSITTTEDDALVYHFLGIKTAGGTVTTPPSGETLVFDEADAGSGGIRFACYRTTQVSAGATGAEGWEISAANDSIGFTIGFKLGELQRDYAPAASGAKKVYLEAKAAQIGGTGTQTGHPLVITSDVLKANNLNMFEDGHADEATEGGLRFSMDEAGAEPLPGRFHFAAAVDPNDGEFEAYTRLPELDGTTSSNNGVYLWWIPGSAKTQPAADAQYGSKQVQPLSYRLNIIGGGYTDETPNGNDATATNTTLSSDVPFGDLESIDFNGSSSRLNIPDSDNSLDLADGQSLTMLSWMIVDTDTGTFQGFMSKRQALDHNYGAFYIADDDSPDAGTFHANFYNGGFRGVTMDFDPNFSKGVWMPVFVEFEDSGTDYVERVYNGTTLINSATWSQEPIVNAHDFIVGATKTGTSTYGEWADGRRKGLRVIFEILPADVKTTIVNNEGSNTDFWDAQWAYTDGDGDGQGGAGGNTSILAYGAGATSSVTHKVGLASILSYEGGVNGSLTHSLGIKSRSTHEGGSNASATHSAGLIAAVRATYEAGATSSVQHKSGRVSVVTHQGETSISNTHVTGRVAVVSHDGDVTFRTLHITARQARASYEGGAIYSALTQEVAVPSCIELSIEHLNKITLTIEKVG